MRRGFDRTTARAIWRPSARPGSWPLDATSMFSGGLISPHSLTSLRLADQVGGNLSASRRTAQRAGRCRRTNRRYERILFAGKMSTRAWQPVIQREAPRASRGKRPPPSQLGPRAASWPWVVHTRRPDWTAGAARALPSRFAGRRAREGSSSGVRRECVGVAVLVIGRFLRRRSRGPRGRVACSAASVRALRGGEFGGTCAASAESRAERSAKASLRFGIEEHRFAG